MILTRYQRSQQSALATWQVSDATWPNARLDWKLPEYAEIMGFHANAVRHATNLRTVARASVIKCDQAWIVLSSGTNGPKGPAVLEGWVDADESAKVNGFNVNTWKDAEQFVVTHMLALFENPLPVYLYGHSAGGMLVEAIAKYLAVHGLHTVREIQTYGAPKPAYAAGCLSGPRITRMRWMTRDDYVPHLPYQTVGGACWRFLTAFTGKSQPWLYCHGVGGHVLLGAGRIRLESLPVVSAPDRLSMATLWFLKPGPEESNPHSILSYLAAMSGNFYSLPEPLEIDFTGPASQPEPPPFAAVALPQLPPRERGIPQPVQIVGDQMTVASGQEYPVTITGVPAMPFAKITKVVKADVLRIGNVYQVTWMNRTIMLCPTISKCKVIARAINRFIRTLGNTDSVTSADVMQSLADFLAAAQIAGGGFEPPLNVV